MIVKSYLLKPMTVGMTNYAKRSPHFERTCFSMANRYYQANNRLSKMLGLPYQLTPLTSAQAVELGTQLVGEGVLFGGGAGILYYEYYKSSKIPSKCQELEERVDRLEKEIAKN